jgi:hypothetical protein
MVSIGNLCDIADETVAYPRANQALFLGIASHLLFFENLKYSTQ